jgi:hypothetical protein
MPKKSFDAVEYMRKARERLSEEWEEKPRSEEISYLREKYGRLIKRKGRKAVA